MFKRLAVILVAVMALMGVPAIPAHAALNDCWFGYVCLWDGPDAYGGAIHRIPAQRLGYCYNIPAESGFNDRADWFYNNMYTAHVQFYRDRDCKGHLQHRQNGCFGGPHPGGTYGQFWFTRRFECEHNATKDNNSTTSVWFNTG